jgi:hypothetical protein
MLINDASITGSLIVNASSSFQNIAVSGNILPGTNNVYNLGSADKHFKEIFVSTSSINFVDNGIVTASLSANTLNSLLQNTSSANVSIVNINSFTQSFSASVSSSITSISSSVTTTITTLSSSVSTSFSSSAASITSLSSSVSSSVTSLSSSVALVDLSQNSRLSSIESVTGSYSKLSGGNTFIGTQIVSGSTFIAGDLIVQGSSSIQYISASSVSIGTNTINLNTNVPAVRFAGISIFDSGSNAQTASIFWDGFCNKFIYSNPSSVGYSGGMLMSGPRNTGSIGEENGLTTGYLAVAQGSDHISSSAIYHTTSSTCFYGNTTITSTGVLTSTNLVGTICANNGVISGSSQVDGTLITNKSITIAGTSTALGGTITLATMTGGSAIHSGSYLATATTANLSENTNLYYTDARVKTKLDAETVVSGSKTISGITLGSNLATLTISTGLSGTSYNGSTGVTISNSGVTSIVAGTGISINQGTAAVTVTNSITNNNQLTNGAGYITSAGTSANSNLLNSISAVNLYNNMGDSHGTRSSFDASSPSYGFGYRYVQGLTNGPGTGGGAPGQFYSWYIGLGVDYPATGAGSYGAMFAVDRNSTGPYLSVRYNENNSFGSWRKINAGLADGITGALAVTGAITATGDITAFYSDGRLKENLKIISNPIEKIRKITGYTYNTNELGKVLLNNENDNDNKVGLIAQDLQKVLPEAVKLAPFDRDEKGNSKSGENYLTIQYEKVVPLLVEAIKEQQIKIDNLTIEVENLKKPKGL